MRASSLNELRGPPAEDPGAPSAEVPFPEVLPAGTDPPEQSAEIQEELRLRREAILARRTPRLVCARHGCLALAFREQDGTDHDCCSRRCYREREAERYLPPIPENGLSAPPPASAVDISVLIRNQIEGSVRGLVLGMLRNQGPSSLPLPPFSLQLTEGEVNAKLSREILAKVLENELVSTTFHQPSTKAELVALHKQANEIAERLTEIRRISWADRSGTSPSELVLGSFETLFTFELEKAEMMKELVRRHDVPNMSMATKRGLTERALELWTRTRDTQQVIAQDIEGQRQAQDRELVTSVVNLHQAKSNGGGHGYNNNRRRGQNRGSGRPSRGGRGGGRGAPRNSTRGAQSGVNSNPSAAQLAASAARATRATLPAGSGTGAGTGP